MTRHHLTDGPTEIPAWKSCEGCRHFRQRGIMPGGDCAEASSSKAREFAGMRYVQRTPDGRVVTPSWCPVLLREGM